MTCAYIGLSRKVPPMRNFMLAASLVLSLGALSACGKKSGIDGALDKMEDYKKQVCACTTVDCATKAMEDMGKYMEGQEKAMKDVKPSKDQDERADKLGDEMSACMTKLMEKSAPATP